MFLLGPVESYKGGKITVCNNLHSSFLLFRRVLCFRESLIAESDLQSRRHLSIRSGNKMYPLLEPLTRDIVCRLDQFVAAGMTGTSAKITKVNVLLFHRRGAATTVKIYSADSSL